MKGPSPVTTTGGGGGGGGGAGGGAGVPPDGGGDEPPPPPPQAAIVLSIPIRAAVRIRFIKLPPASRERRHWIASQPHSKHAKAYARARGIAGHHPRVARFRRSASPGPVVTSKRHSCGKRDAAVEREPCVLVELPVGVVHVVSGRVAVRRQRVCVRTDEQLLGGVRQVVAFEAQLQMLVDADENRGVELAIVVVPHRAFAIAVMSGQQPALAPVVGEAGFHRSALVQADHVVALLRQTLERQSRWHGGRIP